MRTAKVTINPTMPEILMISDNREKPPLGSINIPIVTASKKIRPMRVASRIKDRWLSKPAVFLINHNPAAKLSIGTNTKVPHCNRMIESCFIAKFSLL